MLGECYVCKKIGNVGKHHIIHGHGKRKNYQTRESLVDICHVCHKLVHDKHNSQLDFHLKLHLQAVYLEKGYDEETVRRLMGGKLLSTATNKFVTR